MTIVLAQTTLTIENSAVPLARYAYLTGYPECRFWGVSNADEPDEPCRQLLTKAERDMIAKYLSEAQEEVENVCGYHLNPKWDANEEQVYTIPVRTHWGKVIAGGVKGDDMIQAGAAVNMLADPHTVTVATTVTDVDEIHIFHPGTDVEINPSAIAVTGIAATISIPRCRTVTQAAYSAGGEIDYTVDANFESTLDVRRIYNDTTTQAELVWTHGKTCSCGLSCCQCESETETACIGIRNAEVGAVNVLRADYASGAWTTVSLGCSCRAPDNILLNYCSGLTPLTYQAEDTILRLAHAKMPTPPCGCSVLQDLWKRDRNVPAVLDAKRLDCPFGLSDGSWVAWRFANSMRIVRGGVL